MLLHVHVLVTSTCVLARGLSKVGVVGEFNRFDTACWRVLYCALCYYVAISILRGTISHHLHIIIYVYLPCILARSSNC